ncbi:hypothetical protein RRG08_058813 [Elysia crispata]|uniref:Uncharacterized protein n=1 Tax=Elysia crispata TaxID=231223 RepID=A0AAE0YXW5_9GAST|nr:hypothetical protein RRG08_058813 [Elysia crispata]
MKNLQEKENKGLVSERTRLLRCSKPIVNLSSFVSVNSPDMTLNLQGNKESVITPAANAHSCSRVFAQHQLIFSHGRAVC